jgi:hypothetical protein
VLIAICVIVVYKTTTAKQSPAGSTASALAAPTKPVEDKKQVVYKIKTATQPPADNAASAFATPTKPVEDKKQVGEFLDSLSSLNTVAVNQDTVFVFVPGKGDTTAAEATAGAIQSAKRTLESKGIRIGLYSLNSSSPEYAKIAAQLSLPGLLVMTKGRGVAAVSGEITETKLLQAYVASSRAGGCGPSGCGPSSSKCQ